MHWQRQPRVWALRVVGLNAWKEAAKLLSARTGN